MNPWALMPYMAGAGLLGGLAKYEFEDKPKAEAYNHLQAETTRYSPWTGLKADPLQRPSAINDMLQSATGMGMLGMNIGQAQSAQNLQNKQADWLDRGGGPAAVAATSPANSGMARDPNQQFGGFGVSQGYGSMYGNPWSQSGGY